MPEIEVPGQIRINKNLIPGEGLLIVGKPVHSGKFGMDGSIMAATVIRKPVPFCGPVVGATVYFDEDNTIVVCIKDERIYMVSVKDVLLTRPPE